MAAEERLKRDTERSMEACTLFLLCEVFTSCLAIQLSACSVSLMKSCSSMHWSNSSRLSSQAASREARSAASDWRWVFTSSEAKCPDESSVWPNCDVALKLSSSASISPYTHVHSSHTGHIQYASQLQDALTNHPTHIPSSPYVSAALPLQMQHPLPSPQRQ